MKASDAVFSGEVVGAGKTTGGGLDKFDSEESIVPVTRYQFKVSDSVYGGLKNGQIIEIEVMGGTVGGVNFVVDDAPLAEIGHKYLVFGNKAQTSLYSVRGANAGLAESSANGGFSLSRSIGTLFKDKSAYTISELRQKANSLNMTE